MSRFHRVLRLLLVRVLQKTCRAGKGARWVFASVQKWTFATWHIFSPTIYSNPKTKPTVSDRCVPTIWSVLFLFWPTIWSVLFLFWPREQVEKWKNTTFHDNSNRTAGEDGVSNMLCLRPDLQRAWAQGRFALRPMNLSDDKKTMDLEFHWMPRYDHT
ncbi:hypothetical protein BDW71DRAFT_172634 [Aspergillus fruticulosus]